MNKNVEFDANECVEVVENCEVTENLGKRSLGKSILGIGLIAAAAGVVAVVVRKNKDKIDAWRVKKLEKRGYTVLPPNQFDLDEDVDVDSNEQ